MAEEKDGLTPEEVKEKYSGLVDRYNRACSNVDELHRQIEVSKENPDVTEEERDKMVADFSAAVANRDGLYEQMKKASELERAKNQHRPVDLTGGRLVVHEPDLYTAEDEANGKVSFMRDLYYSTIKPGENPTSSERIQSHQKHEIEKRAVTSATLGGIIPPQYLVDMYAKASRNGRVFADQVNGSTLPDVGMSVVFPRLTQGLAAAAQTTQNTAVVTQDPTETDLSVNVNTISGYSPVSRQGIERAAYSDRILFEDLVARYWAVLDSYCINGTGSNNQPLGLLNTGSIATSTASTASVAGVWPKIADLIQQINTNMGGIGYVADKIFMHPRRWGFFEAALDSQNRPLMPTEGSLVNTLGAGIEAGYGFVGRMHGLSVFVDANIPTTLGATTNADPIIVISSPVVHLLERASDPVTLSFEQTGATSLTVNLIVYGYVAFTAGRYPGASGAVTGAGLVPPTF